MRAVVCRELGPASQLVLNIFRKLTLRGNSAHPNRITSQESRVMPKGFPITSPNTMPILTGPKKVKSNCSGTPALARATRQSNTIAVRSIVLCVYELSISCRCLYESNECVDET